MRVAVLGLGERGLAMAARAGAMGHDTALFDPDPARHGLLGAATDRTSAALGALYDVALPQPGAATRAPGISEAVARADLIVNAAPDRLALQQKLIQAAQSAAAPGAPLLCLARDLPLAELSACAARPAEIAHLRLADPSWLMPAAEVTGTSEAARAAAALGLVAQGAGALDHARGLFVASRGDVAVLIALLRALKRAQRGLGAALARHEEALAPPVPEPSAALPTLSRRVPPDWADYNAHMNEQFYLTCFSDATDRLLLWAGMDAACVAGGASVFTVETHIRHVDEVPIGARLGVETRVIEGGGKRLHLWHTLSREGTLCATGEQLLLHMDLTARRVAPPPPDIAAYLGAAMQAQAGQPPPEGFGRHVAAPRT